MRDAQVPLQRAIVAAQKADAVLSGLIASRLFDRVPADAAFPYSSFGRMETSGGGGRCDTGVEIDVQIDSWSRAVGTVEAKTIGAAWAALLSQPEALTVEGFRVTLVRILSINGQSGLDGVTSQSILRVRFYLSAQA